jgi:hypothetical protein
VKVLVIPEDPSLDQYILKPLAAQLFAELGIPARVEVLWNPRLRGVSQALDGAVISDIMATYSMIDLFLLLVDRDGEEQRAEKVRAREEEHPGRLIACLAIEEIEVWMLALHRDSLSRPWSSIRAARDPKERFARPFLAERAPRLDAGAGRKWAMRGVGAQWKGIVEVCPELGALRQRIEDWRGRGRS